ncbi:MULTISPECIES: hypothetical protein [Enterococcus]|uniref:hypothetical protein n=1 Tax=Enterococcus TaxID=1350 RepID=UPI000330699B|nr:MULTISPECIES: hypothetical protein [Enterococcus]EGO7725475.1 hypothetical protein [Enterococcus faecalis]EGO8644191.1 hypothetical protein [Enterococcus faecalis]EGS8308134.1 hypothetical protein [Enterococcus faecalis]EJG4466683.1 hypothetical protein [Enterococcus faecalis]EJI7180126.1 hypothetical protein [Enterococcus faecalis]
MDNIPKNLSKEELELVTDMLYTLRDFLKKKSIRSNSKTGQMMNELEIELQNIALKHLFNQRR